MQNVSCHFYQPLNQSEDFLAKQGQTNACKKKERFLLQLYVPIIIYSTLDKHVIVYLRSAYNRQTIKKFKIADERSSRVTSANLCIKSVVKKVITNIWRIRYSSPICIRNLSIRLLPNQTIKDRYTDAETEKNNTHPANNFLK